jgi:hypothetical protein
MSKVVLTNVNVVVNSIDLSDHVQKVTIDDKKDTVDVTSMGAVSKEYLLGLGDATVAVTFFQDFGASSIDATLQPLHAAGSIFPISIIPNGTAASATNPRYSGTFILPEYVPIDGQVGAASMLSVTFQNASQSGITRGTV